MTNSTNANIATVANTNQEVANKAIDKVVAAKTVKASAKKESTVKANKYLAVFDKRIDQAIANKASASNVKKLNNLRSMLNSEQLNKLLENAKVEASVFERAIYAIEKVIKFATQAIDFNAKLLNENTYAMFKTIVNCHNKNVTFTRDIARACLSNDIKLDDKVSKSVLFQRNIIQDVSTISAQSQTSIDALKSLNLIKDSATSKNAYDINVNALFNKLCDNLKLELKTA